MAHNIHKRIITFRNSDSPLTSKRVRIMLSNPEDSAKLASAVRALRYADNNGSKFELSEDTQKAIEEAKKLSA